MTIPREELARRSKMYNIRPDLTLQDFYDWVEKSELPEEFPLYLVIGMFSDRLEPSCH